MQTQTISPNTAQNAHNKIHTDFYFLLSIQFNWYFILIYGDILKSTREREIKEKKNDGWRLKS